METPTILNTGSDSTAALIAAMSNRNDGTALGGMGGLVAGLVLGGGLGNGGIFGNRHGGIVENNFVTADQLQTAVGTIVDNQQNTEVLSGIGEVKQSIFQAEGNLQLAGAENTSAIRSHLGQVENTIVAGQMNLANGINGVNVNVLQSAAATREAVALYGNQNLLATKESQNALQAQAAANTNAILAALKDQEIASLNRQLTVAELRGTEDRAEARARSTEVNVSQTVTQIQAQAQDQSQRQQQLLLLSSLVDRVNHLQSAVATNSNLIVGNAGAVATGPQTANPVNVNA